MFDGDLELTIEEEEKIQNPANIYYIGIGYSFK